MPRGGRRPNAGRKKKAQATPAAPATATPTAAPASATPTPPAESAPPLHPLLAKCSRKEQAFILALVNDPAQNQRTAYERAGFRARGDSADANASKLLRKDRVRAAYAALRGQVAAVAVERAELTAARVLEELRRLAFVDVTGVFDDAGNLKPFSQWTAEQRSALAGFEVIIKNAKAGDGETDTVHKVKMVSKEKALEMLAKHFKLLTEVLQVEGDWDAKAARLAAARKRA